MLSRGLLFVSLVLAVALLPLSSLGTSGSVHAESITPAAVADPALPSLTPTTEASEQQPLPDDESAQMPIDPPVVPAEQSAVPSETEVPVSSPVNPTPTTANTPEVKTAKSATPSTGTAATASVVGTEVSPSLALSVSKGTVSSTTWATLKGFPASTSLGVFFDYGGYPTSFSGRTDSTGTAKILVTIPSVPSGVYTISTFDGLATAFYQVIPSLSLSVTSGYVGTVVTAALLGSSPQSLMQLYWYNGAESIRLSSAYAWWGAATFSFVVPASAAGGQHTVEVGGAKASFTVLPRVILSATSGASRAKITVKASGFKPGESIQIRWYTGSTYTVMKTVTASTYGAVTFNIYVPSRSTLGRHKLELKGSAGSTVARTITVTSS